MTKSYTDTKTRTGYTRTGATRFLTLSVVILLMVTASVGGYRWWAINHQTQAQTGLILHTVARGNFIHEVTERGEIKSAGVTEIRSEVKTKNTPGVTILRVIPEGSQVQQGDFLVELDSSALDSERTSQQIIVNTTQAVVIEARNMYETALIALREYQEGTYLQERQTIESEIFVAEENLNRSKEYYQYSKKLATKGYVNQLQLEADQFAVEKSIKELEAAQTMLKVLDQFTKAKMAKQLESDILIANAKWNAEKSSLELELQKLHDIEQQIGNCTIVAPREGTIVYAHERDRHGDSNFIVEEGTLVRERQAILELPDPESMEVELSINESLVQYVRPGMPATIVPVGLGDLELSGSVNIVNQYAEPSGWRKANVKEYLAHVGIDQPPADLRAGMTVSVTIRCEQVSNAIQVPVQAVYAHGNQFYCFVFGSEGWISQAVQCGPTNDKFFVIEKGLQESDQVAMNPRRALAHVQLPPLPAEQQQQAVPQLSQPDQAVAANRR
ncbi:MAG: efflux transporter periplasmic adaptor subunit [Pirellulales bacterium]